MMVITQMAWAVKGSVHQLKYKYNTRPPINQLSHRHPSCLITRPRRAESDPQVNGFDNVAENKPAKPLGAVCFKLLLMDILSGFDSTALHFCSPTPHHSPTSASPFPARHAPPRSSVQEPTHQRSVLSPHTILLTHRPDSGRVEPRYCRRVDHRIDLVIRRAEVPRHLLRLGSFDCCAGRFRSRSQSSRRSG
jgi:hypothetical protein